MLGIRGSLGDRASEQKTSHKFPRGRTRGENKINGYRAARGPQFNPSKQCLELCGDDTSTHRPPTERLGLASKQEIQPASDHEYPLHWKEASAGNDRRDDGTTPNTIESANAVRKSTAPTWTCSTAVNSTTRDAFAIQPSHRIPQDYHKSPRVSPHRGSHQSIRGCLEEKAAGPRALPPRTRNTRQ